MRLRGSSSGAMRVAVLAAIVLPLSAAGSDFGPPDPDVARAPDAPSRLMLPAGARVIDAAVSPVGPEVALLVAEGGATRILRWVIGSAEATTMWTGKEPVRPAALAWHPSGGRLFVAFESGIWTLAPLDGAGAWARIATPHGAVTRLVPSPRPFVTAWPERDGDRETVEHRLFFALTTPGGKPVVASVTERGAKPYVAVGPRPEAAADARDPEAPSTIAAESATPEGFHPAGHLMLWRDGAGCHHVVDYFHFTWGESRRLEAVACGGEISFTPNGLGLLHHDAGKPGVTLLLDHGKEKRQLAPERRFSRLAGMTPDGRGIVGVLAGEPAVVAYEPVDVPLHDVANAWMFVESPVDRGLLQKDGGLFRPLDLDQLYALYETEAYACGDYDRTTPTRPYLVTTDLWWELFAAAFEGVFVVTERQKAIPAFWAFVTAGRDHFAKLDHVTRWAGVFDALDAVRRGDGKHAEAALIMAAEGSAASEVLGEEFDYGELKPRGHYAADPELARYFQAFKYLTRVAATPDELAELASVPATVRDHAKAWIAAYAPFIAPPRGPILWDPSVKPAPWCLHPVKDPRLFPLSWGFDNEALHRTVFHSDWPAEEQITGPDGPRLLPSGLDVAAFHGSTFARGLLGPELARYPPLQRLYGPPPSGLMPRDVGPAAGDGLYQRWLGALAVQWADTSAEGSSSPSSAQSLVPPADHGTDEAGPPRGVSLALWRAKRLQTGLASWATLRHATVLVNDRGEAECGEGGYEEIVLAPPRGSVEPDPRTFAAIGDLFDALIAQVKGTAVAGLEVTDPYMSEEMKGGVLRRLQDAASRVRRFQDMARRAKHDLPLTDGDQQEILYVARVAEHNMKVLKSLARADLALSNPDPMGRIADVYGSAATGYLLAAVGGPLEWDLVVPAGGRRQVCKGAVYGYYELVSAELLDDETWRSREADTPRPAWVQPFVSATRPTCPPPAPF